MTTGRDAKEARTAAPDDAGQPEADMAAMGKLRATLAGKRWPAARAAEIRALLSQFENERAVPVKAPGVSVAVEVAEAPWDPERRLVRVVVTAAPATSARAASANVVLLIDVSRSMDAPNRLPLVQAAARRLLRDLQPDDRVSVVTYAGEARVALPPTPMTRAAEVRTVLGA
ncbi:MAG: VWA domain-containing protein, partial [Verrucomicrobia bacterium]|nr:VWA domain-containing protein [Verrucomicrobiota bacterium]